MTTLHIPKPCHENWDAMSPQERGRHCAVCDKTVVDVTKMRPAEGRRFLGNLRDELAAGAHVCVRVHADAKGRLLAPSATRRLLTNGLAAVLAMTIAGCQGEGPAVQQAQPAQQQQQQQTSAQQPQQPELRQQTPQPTPMMGAPVPVPVVKQCVLGEVEVAPQPASKREIMGDVKETPAPAPETVIELGQVRAVDDVPAPGTHGTAAIPRAVSAVAPVSASPAPVTMGKPSVIVIQAAPRPAAVEPGQVTDKPAKETSTTTGDF